MYNELNYMGYEGDTFIHGELQKLIKKFKIDQIIETGTYQGNTTKRLLEFGIPVSSIESDVNNHRIASDALANTSVNLRLGNSGKALKNMIAGKRVLFYLDAHWESYCPLLDELRQIAESGVTAVIFIHDFKVPHKAFGFDSYNGKAFDFDFVHKALENVYGGDFDYHYNDKADGAARGCIYVYPKKSAAQAKVTKRIVQNIRTLSPS